jgi:hypothetical protein
MTQTPIIDYHGTEVEVDLVFKSAGVFVYVEIDDEFARLTPAQAVELAQRLTAAASGAPGESA